ncbi:MAG: lipid-binding SYLF domain-containing protein [Desulfobacterales bacterium]
MRKTTFLVLSIVFGALMCIVPAVTSAAGTDADDMGAVDDRTEMGEEVHPGEQAAVEDDVMNQESAAVMVENAAAVFGDVMAAREERIPASELQDAAGVLIIPDVIKAGLIAGGRHGTGVLVTREQDQWNLPVFASITGGSLGAQIGVEAADLVMIFKEEENVQQILEGDDFTLGVDASVAAGSAGAAAKASMKDAEVITYQRAEGLFAGVSVTGSVINLDTDALMAYYNLQLEETGELRGYYGKEEQLVQEIAHMDGEEAAEQNIIKNVPQSAQQLHDALNRYFAETPQETQEQP